MLDADHGGRDGGHASSYDKEKLYTLKVAHLAREILLKNGCEVVMTRDKDKTVSDDERVKIANKYPDGIFISIHFNSGKLEENGIETYVMDPAGVPHPGKKVRRGDFRLMPSNASGSASLALATAAHSRALMYLNSQNTGNNWSIEDRGVKRARYKLLTEIKIPSMRIEGGFLTNLDEAAKINSKAYQQALAAAIARAVDIYKKSTAKK